MALVLVGQFIPASSVQLHFWTRSIILEFAMGLLIGQMALAGVRPGRGMAVLLAAAAIAWLAFGRLYPGSAPTARCSTGCRVRCWSLQRSPSTTLTPQTPSRAC